MAVDTSVIGKPTGAWQVARRTRARSPRSPTRAGRRQPGVPRRRRRRTAAGFDGIPAPPTFTFAMPFWGAFAEEQPPTRPAARTRCTRSWASCIAQGRARAPRRAGVHVPPHVVAGDVLERGRRSSTSTRRRPKGSIMTFVVMETVWTRRSRGGAGRDRALQPHRPAAKPSRRHAVGRLQDKVAIITGAGQGIGLAYARAVPRRRRQGRGRRRPVRQGARPRRRDRRVVGHGRAARRDRSRRSGTARCGPPCRRSAGSTCS